MKLSYTDLRTSKGIPLNGTPNGKEIAYKYEDIFFVIDMYEKLKIPILSGEAWKLGKNGVYIFANFFWENNIAMTQMFFHLTEKKI